MTSSKTFFSAPGPDVCTQPEPRQATPEPSPRHDSDESEIVQETESRLHSLCEDTGAVLGCLQAWNSEHTERRINAAVVDEEDEFIARILHSDKTSDLVDELVDLLHQYQHVTEDLSGERTFCRDRLTQVERQLDKTRRLESRKRTQRLSSLIETHAKLVDTYTDLVFGWNCHD